MKTLLSVALIVGFIGASLTYATGQNTASGKTATTAAPTSQTVQNTPTTQPLEQKAAMKKVTRSEAKKECLKSNPGMKGKELRECVSKKLST